MCLDGVQQKKSLQSANQRGDFIFVTIRNTIYSVLVLYVLR